MRHLDELPYNGDVARGEISNGLESSYREIDRVPVFACRARILDGYSNGFVVRDVCDFDLLSAERRLDVSRAIPSVVHGSNQALVTMNGSASTSYIILVKESSVSTRLKGAGDGSRGGGR